MARRVNPNVEANFVGGLKTEATGLNFPENAATETYNCVYDKIGNVERRLGFDNEANSAYATFNSTGQAISTYRWRNAGGDGTTSFIVQQNGGNLYFYKDSAAVAASSISAQRIGSVIAISDYTVAGSSFTSATEVTYADGNGYLLVFHPDCNPIYCVYDGSVVTAAVVELRIRDFVGVNDLLLVDNRPGTLSDTHKYNITNQGWVSGSAWSQTSTTSNNTNTGTKTFTIATGLTGSGAPTNGQRIKITIPNTDQGSGLYEMAGSVTGYNSGTGVLSVTVDYTKTTGGTLTSWIIVPTSTGFITTWQTAVGLYPSNSDIWWNYKDADDVFAPSTTYSNVGVNMGQAPRGHYILNAFSQDRSLAASIPSLTAVTTLKRPKIGAWYMGRAWYAGVDAAQQASGTANYYSWTEEIYFSQVIQDPGQLGSCYQVNDPTSEKLFDLLPTDGGVIKIQGAGSIIKLFAVNNGILVFAQNGIWFITGNNGIGFTANDYTIVKISDYRALSTSSFVDVGGYPMFWNEEAIYFVTPQQNNSFTVEPVTLGTIQSFYEDIPLTSKVYARGVYNPVDFTVQWVYRSEEGSLADTSVRAEYHFDRILNFNMYTKAFYPYSFQQPAADTPVIRGIVYTPGVKGTTSTEGRFSYLISIKVTSPNVAYTFAEEKDSAYKDWKTYTDTGVDYDSHFVCGYKVHGQAQRKFQSNYVYVFFDTSDNTEVAYRIQGFWDWANSGDSGRYASIQLGSYEQTVDESIPHYNVRWKRHKIRGHGLAMQIKIRSVAGKPFKIIGWSVFETQNASV